MKTATTAASNWSGSSTRAVTAYNEGVQTTTKDQAGLAVAAQPRLLSNFTDSVISGRWAAGVQRRGTPYWKSQTQAKSANYSTGFAAGNANYTAAAQKFMPAIANIVASLPPRGDINQNLQRMSALALGLHQLKGTLGAG